VVAVVSRQKGDYVKGLYDKDSGMCPMVPQAALKPEEQRRPVYDQPTEKQYKVTKQTYVRLFNNLARNKGEACCELTYCGVVCW
jgi:hypothetical protein